MAYEKGADGIVISNHGGRQLDTALPSIDVLLEIRQHAPHLLRPEYRVPDGASKRLIENPENLTTPVDPNEKPGRKFEILQKSSERRGRFVRRWCSSHFPNGRIYLDWRQRTCKVYAQGRRRSFKTYGHGVASVILYEPAPYTPLQLCASRKNHATTYIHSTSRPAEVHLGRSD